MRKIAVLTILLIMGLAIMLLAACDDESETPTPSDYELREQSRQIAEEFVRSSPTFQFDGIDESLMQLDTEEPAGIEAWKFTYEFESAYPGFGDRSSDESLAKNVTRHEAEVTVSKNEITRAILDGEWDMVDQEGTDEWEWSEAGEQALYGIVSVFVILILLILLTRLSGIVIAKIEKTNDDTSTKKQH